MTTDWGFRGLGMSRKRVPPLSVGELYQRVLADPKEKSKQSNLLSC